MKCDQLNTRNYRHEVVFYFDGKPYLLNSYVKLTPYGKEYLKAASDTVQLTQRFYMPHGGREIECHKFITRYVDMPPRPFTMSTDEPLEKLVECVVVPAKYTPPNKKPDPIKIMNRDWEVPDVLFGWIVFLVFFIGVEILKDWALKLILRLAGGWFFSNWRNMRMMAEGYVDFSSKQNSEKKKDETDKK